MFLQNQMERDWILYLSQQHLRSLILRLVWFYVFLFLTLLLLSCRLRLVEMNIFEDCRTIHLVWRSIKYNCKKLVCDIRLPWYELIVLYEKCNHTLGITAAPFSTCHLSVIWAGDLRCFWAIWKIIMISIIQICCLI